MPRESSAVRMVLVTGSEHSAQTLETSCGERGMQCTVSEVNDLRELNRELSAVDHLPDLILMDGEHADIPPERVSGAIDAHGVSVPFVILADEESDDTSLQRFDARDAFVLLKRRNYGALLPLGLQAILRTGMTTPGERYSVPRAEKRKRQIQLVEKVLGDWAKRSPSSERPFAYSSLESGKESPRMGNGTKTVPFPIDRSNGAGC